MLSIILLYVLTLEMEVAQGIGALGFLDSMTSFSQNRKEEKKKENFILFMILM
jgi:hypothetical protein